MKTLCRDVTCDDHELIRALPQILRSYSHPIRELGSLTSGVCAGNKKKRHSPQTSCSLGPFVRNRKVLNGRTASCDARFGATRSFRPVSRDGLRVGTTGSVPHSGSPAARSPEMGPGRSPPPEFPVFPVFAMPNRFLRNGGPEELARGLGRLSERGVSLPCQNGPTLILFGYLPGRREFTELWRQTCRLGWALEGHARFAGRLHSRC